MLKKILNFITALIIAMPVYLFTGYQTVHAQSVSAYEVIAAVNDLRASYGLEPYETSNKWMRVAQEHSEYQASIDTLTHLREDGSDAGDNSISSENIASGYSLSAAGILAQWADYWHAFTMIGFSSGLVGCGVAQGDNGVYYYTLDVKNTGKTTGLPSYGSSIDTSGAGSDSVSSGDDSIPQVTSIPYSTSVVISTALPAYTATVREDGSVVHTISSGETVWSIAEMYGISEDDLIALNDLDTDNPVIYPGYTLLIHTGYTATPTPTITNTPLPPTRTLRPSRTPQPSSTPGSVTPYGTGTQVPLVPDNGVLNSKNVNKLGIVTVALACTGVAVLVFGRYINRRKRK